MIKIQLVGVSKRYYVGRSAVDALSKINLMVNSGEFLALVGPSGSGKSTILQIIGGIEQPTDGQVIVGGTDITKLSSQQLSDFRRKNIGVIFQQFYLEPNLTLRQNIELPAVFFDFTAAARDQRTSELASFMGLQNHLSHHPSELSGGQIQRAAIARAIYNNPPILIADEPTSNLDQDNVANVISLFRQIQQAYGATIIVASHDQHFAQYADRIVQLENGRIITLNRLTE